MAGLASCGQAHPGRICSEFQIEGRVVPPDQLRSSPSTTSPDALEAPIAPE